MFLNLTSTPKIAPKGKKKVAPKCPKKCGSFRKYECRLSIFLLEVQPYLFVFISATFGASFALFLILLGRFFFCHFGLFLGSGSGSKTFLEPTNVDYQFLFWKYSPIFLFLIRPNFGPFCTFWALRGYFFWPVGAIFGVKVRFKHIF